MLSTKNARARRSPRQSSRRGAPTPKLSHLRPPGDLEAQDRSSSGGNSDARRPLNGRMSALSPCSPSSRSSIPKAATAIGSPFAASTRARISARARTLPPTISARASTSNSSSGGGTLGQRRRRCGCGLELLDIAERRPIGRAPRCSTDHTAILIGRPLASRAGTDGMSRDFFAEIRRAVQSAANAS